MPQSKATKGCEGVIKTKVGSSTAYTAVTEVRDWTLTLSAELIDVSVLGNCSRQKIAGIKSGTGSLTAYLNESLNTASDNKARGGFEEGQTVWMELYPTGATPGTGTVTPDNPSTWKHTKVTFEAIITEVGVSGSAEGLVELTISFETSGTVTWSTI